MKRCFVFLSLILLSSAPCQSAKCLWEFTWWIPGMIDREAGACNCEGLTAPAYSVWPQEGMSWDGVFWHPEKPATFQLGAIQGRLLRCYPDMYPGRGWYALFRGYSRQEIGQKRLLFESATRRGYADDSHLYLWSREGNISSNGYRTDYKQTDYPNVLLGNSKTVTIADAGCYLCCAANALNREGTGVTPPQLNAWLKEHNGFVGLRAKLPVIARYGAEAGERAPFGYKSSISARECIMRNLSSWVSVKNSGHWVNLVKFFGPLSDNDFLILDPMNRTSHLFGYRGVNTNNTRALYGRMYTMYAALPNDNILSLLGVTNTSIDETLECEGTSEAYHCGSLAIYSENNLQMNLFYQGRLIASAEQECVESPLTGEEIFVGSVIEISEQPSGEYRLEINGTTNSPFKVVIISDKGDGGELREITWEGALGADGKAEYTFSHQELVMFDDLGPVEGIPEGTQVFIPQAVVTAVVPTGFYLQPLRYKLPVLFVPSERTDIIPLTVLRNIWGVVQNSQLKINDFVNSSGNEEVEKKPVGVSPTLLPTTFHLFVKTFGRITAILPENEGMILDNKIKVKFYQPCPALEVGQLVTVKGVWHEGVFYVKGAAQVQCLE